MPKHFVERRHVFARDEVVYGSDDFFRLLPELVIDVNLHSTANPSIEECPPMNRSVEHFFQTKSLRTELHLVADIVFGLSHLELDGEHFRCVGALLGFEEFDNVSPSYDTETEGMNAKPADGFQRASRFIRVGVDLFVEDVAANRVKVLLPHILYVNQGTLARAEYVVLQCADLDEVVFRVHTSPDAIGRTAIPTCPVYVAGATSGRACPTRTFRNECPTD